MKQFILNYIHIYPNTSFRYDGNRGLMLENENDNFFSNSFKFSEKIKSQSTRLYSEFYHLYLPLMQEDNYVRPFETLPFYEGQERKYVEIITHLGHSFCENDILFEKFIKDYKNFLVDINCEKDIMSKVEFFFKHDEMPHYSVNEIPPVVKINNTIRNNKLTTK